MEEMTRAEVFAWVRWVGIGLAFLFIAFGYQIHQRMR